MSTMKSKFHILSLLLTIVLCMSMFSVTAFASAEDAPSPTECAPVPSTPSVTDDGPLTPEGNMTLIDDIRTDSDKQFLTVQTKNGNYFYLIIDRSGDRENVHFLNQVDEADLMALMEDAGIQLPPVCNCTEKCGPGKVNTSCPVCKTDISKCTGQEPAAPEVTTEPDADLPTAAPAEHGQKTALLSLALIVILGIGGIVFWFQTKKSKISAKGSTDLDEYDYGEDETEEQEYEFENDDDSEDEE